MKKRRKTTMMKQRYATKPVSPIKMAIDDLQHRLELHRPECRPKSMISIQKTQEKIALKQRTLDDDMKKHQLLLADYSKLWDVPAPDLTIEMSIDRYGLPICQLPKPLCPAMVETTIFWNTARLRLKEKAKELLRKHRTLKQRAVRMQLEADSMVRLCLEDFPIIPSFGSIPYTSNSKKICPVLLFKIREIERQLLNLKLPKPPTTHKYTPNFGYSFGLTICAGGVHADTKLGISGSIHSSRILRKWPDLQNQLVDCVCEIVKNTFGNLPWYKMLMNAISELPTDRLLFGGRIPATNIWWAHADLDEIVSHIDRNVLGATFAFTTACNNRTGKLVVAQPSMSVTAYGEMTPRLNRFDISNGNIIGGRWASVPHTPLASSGVPLLVPNTDTKVIRMSWVIYFDYRVLSRRYIRITMDE